jgi:hypothetical protein
MSRRSKSRDRGRSAFRAGEFEEIGPKPADTRETFSDHPDKTKLQVYEFVKRQFRNYGENHDVDIVPQPSDTWEVAKSTKNLEIPFAVKNIPDCVLFVREMEAMLDVRKPTLEFDDGDFVLKANYRELQRASGRGIKLPGCCGRHRVVEMGRTALMGIGLFFILAHLILWLFGF